MTNDLREKVDELRAFIAAVENCEDYVDTLTEVLAHPERLAPSATAAPDLRDYPNLEAIYMGTISGAFREWPAVRNEFRRYVSAQQAAPVEETATWQPIETAPKDGTPVVLLGSLWNDPNQQMRSCVSWYAKSREDSPAHCLGWFFVAPGYSNGFNPTHWASLPDGRDMKGGE